jgi:hypothetical protein
MKQEERDIKQLLELMLSVKSCFQLGLCCWADSMHNEGIISFLEWYKLKCYITRNRPSRFSSLDAFLHSASPFYWDFGNIEPRIKWIEKHIKKLSE